MGLTEFARWLIDGRNIGILATLMPDGSPHLSPVYVDREGDIVLVNTVIGRVKHLNVKRDPRVSLVVVDHLNPLQYVEIRGRVSDLTVVGAEEHIDKLAKRYMGVEKHPFRRPGQKRIIMKIVAEKIVEYR
ncbi:MAG: PPOX class F420-dependent oxidoreductase [Nitrososphaerota archaeon]